MSESDYETEGPSPQTAVDVFKGLWVSRLPGGLEAGEVPLFEDDRISWLVEQVPIAGTSVLELGPLEGGHSYMLERAAARRVVAVEANRSAYLRCLVVKEVFGMHRVDFLCGDLVKYLAETRERFDLCVASGVLYHMTEPLEMLELTSRVCDRLFLWTHYYDAKLLKQNERAAGHFPDGKGPLYRYEYADALEVTSFCGGTRPHSFWLDRQTLIGTLRELGFDQLEFAFEEPTHINGPALAVLATKTGST
jgi:hypothetical protein